MAAAKRDAELQRDRQAVLTRANVELDALNVSLTEANLQKTMLLDQLERQTFEDALMSFDLPPGDHAVTMAYRPLSFTAGAAISFAALAALLGFGFVRSRRLSLPADERTELREL